LVVAESHGLKLELVRRLMATTDDGASAYGDLARELNKKFEKYPK